jgi:hypothetical protein
MLLYKCRLHLHDWGFRRFGMGVDVSTQTEHEAMAVRPWKVITGSGEFQAIVDSALEGLGPVVASLTALTKTEEFRIFLETALSGMKPAVATWGDVAASPEFKALVGKGLDGAQLAVKAAALIFRSPQLKDLRGDWLALGRDLTVRTLKQAWGPMIQGISAAVTERATQMADRDHLRVAG